MTKPKKDRHGVLWPIFAAVILICAAGIFSFFLLTNNRFKEQEYVQMTTLPKDVKASLKMREAAAQPKPAIRIPILVYHYVEYVKDPKDTIRQSLDITPYTFEEEVKTLIEAGYTFITMSDLEKIIDGKTRSFSKPVIITFDDGYRDFYTNVFPILKKYQIKAVAYIVTGFLDKPNNMDWVQVEEIAKSGLVEVGAHTTEHFYLKGMDKTRAFAQIKNSKLLLEEKLGIPVKTFAYPYGAFDLETINLVKQAGFDNAVGTVPGFSASLENKYFLYRVRPGGRTGKFLLNYLETGK